MFTRHNILKIVACLMILSVSFLYLLQGIRSSSHSYNSKGWQFDITPSLIATKNLIKRGISPYSEISQELIEKAYFGRELDQSERISRHRHHFYYPLYAMFLYTPLIYMDITNALIILWVSYFIVFILTCWLWISMIDLSRNWALSVILISLFLCMPSTYYALQIRQPLFVPLFFVILSSYLIMYGANRASFVTAGVLLFFATIKPQISVLAIGYILLFWLPIFKGIKQNIEVWIGFASSAVFAIAVTDLLNPTWISGFLQVVSKYRDTMGNSGAEILFGKGWLAFVAMIIFCMIGLFMILISLRLKSQSLNLITFAYIIILQPLIFTTNSHGILTGIPVIALAVKEFVASINKQNKKLISVLAIGFSLVIFIMLRYWLNLVIDSSLDKRIIEISINIMSCLPFIRLFYLIPILLLIAIVLYYNEVKYEGLYD